MNPPEIRSSLDTSVVIRLLTGQPLDLASTARRYMAETELAGAKVFVSNLVILEAYFACQHHCGMAKDAVLTASSASSPCLPSSCIPGCYHFSRPRDSPPPSPVSSTD